MNHDTLNLLKYNKQLYIYKTHQFNSAPHPPWNKRAERWKSLARAVLGNVEERAEEKEKDGEWMWRGEVCSRFPAGIDEKTMLLEH